MKNKGGIFIEKRIIIIKKYPLTGSGNRVKLIFVNSNKPSIKGKVSKKYKLSLKVKFLIILSFILREFIKNTIMIAVIKRIYKMPANFMKSVLSEIVKDMLGIERANKINIID